MYAGFLFRELRNGRVLNLVLFCSTGRVCSTTAGAETTGKSTLTAGGAETTDSAILIESAMLVSDEVASVEFVTLEEADLLPTLGLEASAAPSRM